MSFRVRSRLFDGPTALSVAALTMAAVSANHASAQATSPVPVAQHTEAVVVPAPVANQLTVSMAAGATLNAGNTRAYAGNAGGRLGLIRPPHQLTVEALGTMGYARATPQADVEQTSANVIGRGRYDLFLSRMDALFLAVAPRRDTFAGLNLRLQNQAGYLRNLYFPADSHRLWTELGYDLTYDVFARITTPVVTDITTMVVDPDPANPGPITKTTTSSSKPDSEIIHSARIFLGYTNLTYPVANLNLGVETLYDFQDSKNVRVNGLAEITSSITGSFKLGIQSRVFFDNVPVKPAGAPAFNKTDAVIAVQVIYTFDSLAGQPAAPVCDCTAAVAEAHASCPQPAPESAPVVIEPGPSAPAAEAAPAEAAPAAPAPAAEPAAPATP